MKKFLLFSFLLSFFAGAADATDKQNVSASWNKSYRANSLILDNPQIPVQMAVSRFVYHDVRAEIENLARKFNCRDQKLNSDTFSVYNCDFSSDMPELRQNIYGKLAEKGDGGNIYTQIYAVTPYPSNPMIENKALELLETDPIANPLDEWILTSYETDDPSAQQTGVLYENRKRKGFISSSIGIYSDTDKFKFLDNLGKLLLCKKAERLDNGVNFSECSTFYYYELRDLDFPYYVLTSISSDLVNDEESMSFMHRLSEETFKYNREQIRKHIGK